MSALLRLAWRDTRASRRRLLLYSSTIVLGIGALVAVGSFGANVRRTVGDQPRRLLGGDLRVGLDAWPNAGFQRYLESIGATLCREKLFSSPLSERGEGAPRRAVQVLAVDPAFPLYGDFSAAPAGSLRRLRRGERVALVDSDAQEQFRLRVGDRIELAEGTYEVAGVVKEMPGGPAELFRVGGQVVVPWKTAQPDIPAGRPPARGSFRVFVRLPPGADQAAVAAEIKNRFGDSFPVVMTADQLRANLEQALERASRFFALAVFAALFLGAIGVASALHVHIRERLGTVAILRCLGASAADATAIYLAQAAVLGACGALGGAAFGIAAQHGIPPLLRDVLPMRLEVFVAWGPVAMGMAAGFLLCLIFALLPLLAVRRVPPLAVLRADLAEAPAADPARIAVWAVIAGAVFVFAAWQTGRWGAALAYTLALGGAFGVFFAVSAAAQAAVRRWFPGAAPYVLRQGAANLHRPRNRTLLLLLSLGLGLFLVLTIYLVRSTLLSDFAGESSANLIVADIPDDDLAGVLGLARGEGMRIVRQIPYLRIALETVDGKPPRAGRGRLGGTAGPYAATTRDRLLSYERLIAGRLTARVAAGSPVVPVTVAAWTTAGRGGGLRLGDEATWNVAGVPIRTRIAGIRRIEGLHLEPNFAVVFPEGALDGAPKQTILLLRSRTPASTSRLERALGTAAPRARLFDLSALVETIDRVFSKIAMVVDFIAFFTVATGLVILASAVVAGRRQRARESVLLRSLGASRAQLRGVQLAEYGILGLLAGAVGCGLAAVANALLARLVLRIPAGGGARDIAVAAAAIVTVTVATGVFADRGASRRTPLEILREES